MTKRMLIDAAHAEETRVVVVDGQRIEELDFESQSRRQLRGNIYLAKVTRVEPSLQAAFIEYGGNRHGFLAFNEVHPDYYQIPVADREALLQEEAEEEAQLGSDGGVDSADEEEMDEVVERRRRRLMRRYKIQEVIKRRQIMLVQVVKEERGNKGAALTTYLSLAGRYCVLMPNTARGGGISRKITSATDRKRLKTAVQSLEVPKGMGLIIRTAGAARTKIEIKRDYEYLTRLWENIREKTLQSIAPALIYEEEDLVKRAIRDLFDKDIESIQVEGDAGYREARDFMRMIMPSQADKVAHYREPTPLFVRHKIEDQIAQIHSPTVQLKSGGYLVINQTEALVAIDVNSGRSTRERNIETTALKTNLEAAEEAARQLRLRDLAGLIVIDFIDMEEAKNNRAVEKVLKDALKDDRARLQMGKISGFGLMEISRQRRRTGVLEGSTHICEHCQGIGRVRSVESSAVAALRSLEMESVKGGAGAVTVRLATPVGLYILNEKRAYLEELDRTRDLHVSVAIDDKLAHGEVEIERTETREGPPIVRPPPPAEDAESDWRPPADLDEEDEEDVVEADETAAVEETAQEGQDRKRRRRGRGGRRDETQPLREAPTGELEVLDEDGEDDADDAEGGEGQEPRAASDDDGGPRRRRRRRGRRGGRRLREETRPGDVYAWITPPRAPGVGAEGGADPYVWQDPHEAKTANPEPGPRSDGETDGFEPRRGEGEPASGAREGGRDRGRGRRRGRGRSGEGFGRTDRGAENGGAENGGAENGGAENGGAENGGAENGGAENGGVEDGGFEDGASLDAPMEAGAAAPSDIAYFEKQAPPAQRVLEAVDAAPPEAPEPAEAEAATPAKRPRRSRAKASIVAEAAPETAPESAAPAPPPPKAEEAPAYAAPVAAEPIVQAPRAPDPAEISAPPETPRRGWWRRLV